MNNETLARYRSQKSLAIYEQSRQPFIHLLEMYHLPDIALNMQRIAHSISTEYEGNSKIVDMAHFVAQFFTDCLRLEYENLEDAYEDLIQGNDNQRHKSKECVCPIHED
jgi:hypothetical protein